MIIAYIFAASHSLRESPDHAVIVRRFIELISMVFIYFVCIRRTEIEATENLCKGRTLDRTMDLDIREYMAQHTFLRRCRSCLLIIGIVACWKSAVFVGMAYCNAPSNKALILLVLLMAAPLLLLNTLLWLLRWLAVKWSGCDWCAVRRSGGCCCVDSHFKFT